MLTIKRKLLLFGVTLGLIGGVVSCGGGTNSSSSSSQASNVDQTIKLELPKLQDTRSKEVKMNTITTLNGDQVTYNMNSTRIVSLSGTGDLVALGIRPLACEAYAISEGYEDFFYGVEKLNYSQPFSKEELMTYDPEIILVNDTMELANIQTLKKITPAVIPVYYDEYDFGLRLNLLGDLFGLQENAATLIEYANQVKAEGEKQIKELGLKDKTLTIFSFYSSGICIPPNYRDGWTFNKILYKDLGFKKIQKVEDYLNDRTSGAYLTISNELLRQYESEIVLFADISANGSGTVDKVPDIVTTNVGWKSLKAVKNDKVGVFDATLFATKDVLYVQRQYALLINALRKTI